MRIAKHILIPTLTAVLLLTLTLPAFVRASEFQEGDHYVLPVGTVVSEDLFVAGNHVEILGDVEGDLFVAANIVEIKGTVTETAYLMANYAAVHGTVHGDLMVAANQLLVDGTIGQDVRVGAGGTGGPQMAFMSGFTYDVFGSLPQIFPEGLRIDAEARIGGDIHGGVGGSSLLAGDVGGEVGLLGGDTVTFSGRAAQDVDLESAVAVILDPALQVGGELRYTAPTPAAQAPADAQYQAPGPGHADTGAGLGRWVWRTLLSLGGFALVLALSRKTGRDRWERIALTARTQVGGSILWGIASLLVLPILLLLLPGITWALFGTPLAIAVFAFLFVGWFLCWFLSPIVSGRNLATYLQPNLPGEQTAYVGELVGVLLIVLVGRLGTMPLAGPEGLDILLSVLGGLVVTLSYVLAVGGWIQSRVQPKPPGAGLQAPDSAASAA